MKKKTYNINLFNNHYEVTISTSNYRVDNSLAVILTCTNGETFAVLSVNLQDNTLSNNEAYVDTNNCPWAEEFIKRYKLGKPTSELRRSGFCVYPKYKFNLDKLNGIEKVPNKKLNLPKKYVRTKSGDILKYNSKTKRYKFCVGKYINYIEPGDDSIVKSSNDVRDLIKIKDLIKTNIGEIHCMMDKGDVNFCRTSDIVVSIYTPTKTGFQLVWKGKQ